MHFGTPTPSLLDNEEVIDLTQTTDEEEVELPFPDSPKFSTPPETPDSPLRGYRSPTF